MSHLFIGFLNTAVTTDWYLFQLDYFLQLVNILQMVNQLDYNCSSNCKIIIDDKQLLDNNWVV